jgi:hypothetical protein
VSFHSRVLLIMNAAGVIRYLYTIDHQIAAHPLHTVRTLTLPFTVS